MAACFTMNKTNIKLLDNFIQNDYLKEILIKKVQISMIFSYPLQQLKIN